MKSKLFTKISFTRLFFLIAVSIMAASLLTSCVPIEKSETTFEGLYVTSFEASIFYQCNMIMQGGGIESTGNKDPGYWLTSTPDSGFYESLEKFSPLTEPTGLRVYVKFTGILSPTKPFGGYGHLGMYKNEITVTKILEMKPWSDDLC